MNNAVPLPFSSGYPKIAHCLFSVVLDVKNAYEKIDLAIFGDILSHFRFPVEIVLCVSRIMSNRGLQLALEQNLKKCRVEDKKHNGN